MRCAIQGFAPSSPPRGGKGAYRITHALDFAAARNNPKPLVGYSDITILHLALWRKCRIASLHGPHGGWQRDYFGDAAAERLRRALMEPEPVIIHQDQREITAKVIINGTASGILLGGNLNVIGRSVGWACPSFAGSILIIEAIDTYIGQIDSTLTQLRRSGCLDGLRGVAVGQFIRSAEPKPGKWSVIDVVHDQLGELGVPVLGGLPIGPRPTSPYRSTRNNGNTGYGSGHSHDRPGSPLREMSTFNRRGDFAKARSIVYHHGLTGIRILAAIL